jgi:hypothetical protein
LQKETASKRSAIIKTPTKQQRKQRRQIEIREATEGVKNGRSNRKASSSSSSPSHMNNIHKRVDLRGGNSVRQKMRRRNVAESEHHSGV